MTSIAALQLVERGQVGLDDAVSSVLPELADPDILTGFEDGKPQYTKAKNKITLRQLLTHSSGLIYDFMSPELQKYRASRNESIQPGHTILETYLTPLIYEPGTAWSYGPSHDFAGLMVERISKRRLGDYLAENVWKVLGIKDTTFHLSDREDLRSRLTHMSLRDPSAAGGAPTVHSPERFWSSSDRQDDYGGAGLYSTAPQYFKILQAVLRRDERLLRNSSFDEMFKPQLNEGSHAAFMAMLARPEYGPPLGALAVGLEKDYGLAGLLQMEDSPDSMRKGTLMWMGGPNLTWVFPSGDADSVEMRGVFERTMYERAKQHGIANI
ncbi:MAG: hypothetical protein LQ352_002091 [Teloschistes flavicans]|nr:MAG: hypothetical protein LQ352_002091 [Teloschistes flavicans]